MKQIFRKENPYQAVEDIAMAVQHKRTRDAAIELVQPILNEFIDTAEYTKDGLLGSVFVIERIEKLIKNIQNLPQ